MPTGENEKVIIKAIESAGIAAEITLLSNLSLNLLLSASLNQLWSMVNAQQLLVVLPLMKFLLPSSATMFFSGIFAIAAFDLYDTNDFWHDQLEIVETEPLNENFDKFGFGSRYMLNNMGTMILFYIIYPLLMLVQICLRRCRH